MQENPKALLKRKKEIQVSRGQNWGEDAEEARPELSEGCGAGSVQRRTRERQMPAWCAAGVGEGGGPHLCTPGLGGRGRFLRPQRGSATLEPLKQPE